MKVPHGEGIANRTGPELWGGVRKDAAQALVGECVGRTLSRERENIRERRGSQDARRQHLRHHHREMLRAPRGRRTRACTEAPFTGIGRARKPAVHGYTVRAGKSKDVILR